MAHRLVILLALFACASPLFAQQQPKVLAPRVPVSPMIVPKATHKPPVPRSMVGGLWMIDANMKSTLYIKNVVKYFPITVTPILYLSNGRAFTLRDVTLEPSGTAVIHIDDALRDQGIAPWSTIYGYVELDYKWAWDPICATVQSIDAVHSVIFTTGLRSASGASAPSGDPATKHVVEGLWWRHEPGVGGFVALSNTSDRPINATIQTSGSRSDAVGAHSVTVSPHGTKIVELKEIQSMASANGGVRVTYEGRDAALIVNGELEDLSVGYSATIPFQLSPPPASDETSLTLAELGLMVGNADPMMRFPVGTVFTPYSLVRNVSEEPIGLKLSLYWMEGGAARTAPLGRLKLMPHQTQDLAVPSLIAAAGLKNFDGSVNVILDVEGNPRAVVTASGSVDQRNTYVFEVLASAAAESAGRSVSYWNIANGDDAMVTLWNPADEPQDFLFTLFFAGGHYAYPIHLDPRATQMFNVSDIVHTGAPDKDRNIVPADVHEGSGEITGPLGSNQHILLAVDANTYNVQKATCGSDCITCDGVIDSWVDADPFAVSVNGQTQLTFTEEWNVGGDVDSTSDSNWSSNDDTIATVSVGLTTGKAAGSVTISAVSEVSEPEGYQSCIANGPPPACRQIDVPPTGGAPGTVQVPTSLQVISYPVISLTSAGCLSSDYGMAIAITYQVLDQNGSALQSSSMEPQEKVLDVVFNGDDDGSPYPNWVDIYNPSYPGSTKYTNTSGQFLDAPFAACANIAFTETLTQPISMLMNGTNYTVRTNNWTTKTSVPGGHGTMSNGSDINASN